MSALLMVSWLCVAGAFRVGISHVIVGGIALHAACAGCGSSDHVCIGYSCSSCGWHRSVCAFDVDVHDFLKAHTKGTYGILHG